MTRELDAAHDDEFDLYDDRDDDEEDDGFECGAFFNGEFDFYHCQLAGTEDCDWDCPHSAAARAAISKAEGRTP